MLPQKPTKNRREVINSTLPGDHLLFYAQHDLAQRVLEAREHFRNQPQYATPTEYEPHRPLYNSFEAWFASPIGVEVYYRILRNQHRIYLPRHSAPCFWDFE